MPGEQAERRKNMKNNQFIVRSFSRLSPRTKRKHLFNFVGRKGWEMSSLRLWPNANQNIMDFDMQLSSFTEIYVYVLFTSVSIQFSCLIVWLFQTHKNVAKIKRKIPEWLLACETVDDFFCHFYIFRILAIVVVAAAENKLSENRRWSQRRVFLEISRQTDENPVNVLRFPAYRIEIPLCGVDLINGKIIHVTMKVERKKIKFSSFVFISFAHTFIGSLLSQCGIRMLMHFQHFLGLSLCWPASFTLQHIYVLKCIIFPSIVQCKSNGSH